MIAKKSSRFDLEGKRRAFFTLGLLVTGSLTLAAFTYTDTMLVADGGNDVARERIHLTYELETPEKKKEIVELPKIKMDNKIASVDVDPSISQFITLTKNTAKTPDPGVTTDPGNLATGDLIIGDDDDKIVAVLPPVIEWADVDAKFIGGSTEMIKYIHSVIEYPQISKEYEDQGTVYITFVVEVNGDISNIEITQGVSKELDREAKRVVKSFPKWIPGEKDAKKVRTRIRLPIVFTLE